MTRSSAYANTLHGQSASCAAADTALCGSAHSYLSRRTIAYRPKNNDSSAGESPHLTRRSIATMPTFNDISIEEVSHLPRRSIVSLLKNHHICAEELSLIPRSTIAPCMKKYRFCVKNYLFYRKNSRIFATIRLFKRRKACFNAQKGIIRLPANNCCFNSALKSTMSDRKNHA